MSVPLTVGGVTFQYPQQFDRNWGPTLTGWSTAVTNVLRAFPSAGVLTLSPYPSSTLNFANATNTGFLALTVNGSNQLTFNGTPIGASAALTNGHIFVGNVSNQPADVAMTGDVTISNTGVTTLGALKVADSQIATLAGIALTKLASTTPYYWYVADSAGVLSPIGVTASKVVITDANGLPSASSVTPATLAYLDATSSVQGQLNGITGSYLPLSGGTMSGAINMASNKITALANGTNPGDAVALNQLTTVQGEIKYFQTVQATTSTTTSTAGTTFIPATNHSVTITPSSASHRVKITVSIASTALNSSTYLAVTLNRGGTELSGVSLGFALQDFGSAGGQGSPISFSYIDSPSTTSATTYAVYFKSVTGGTVYVGNANALSTLIAEEIL